MKTRRKRQYISWGVIKVFLALGLGTFGIGCQQARADIAAGYQEFLIPGQEEILWQVFTGMDNDPVLVESQGLRSVISVTTSLDNTKIYYDHWENGYTFDPTDPENTNDEIAFLNQGDFVEFESKNVPVNPRGNDLYYDGGDKIYIAGGPISVSRATWPESLGTVYAFSWELYPTRALLTDYSIPFGADLAQAPYNYDDFNRTFLLVQAIEDNTAVEIDDPNTAGVDIQQQLNQGETVLLTDNNANTSVSADKSVQTQILVGQTQSNISSEIRGFTVVPDGLWSREYYAPLGGFSSADSDFYIYNPNDYDIDIQYQDLDKQGTFTMAAKETVAYSDATGVAVPTNTSVYFSSDHVFWGVGSVDTEDFNYDWGFSLIPDHLLANEYFLGWAPGSSEDIPSVNGSPVFVTATEDDTVVYVDYSPTDGVYDESHVINKLETRRFFDPDNENSGMRIWSNNPVVVLWGQDPDASDTGTPYLDLGYPMLPLLDDWLDLVLKLDKSVKPESLSQKDGARAEFSLKIMSYNYPVFNIRANDDLPEGWHYIANTTKVEFSDGTVIDDASIRPTVTGSHLEWDLDMDLGIDEYLTITFEVEQDETTPDGFSQNNAQAVGNRLAGAQIFSPIATEHIFLAPLEIDKNIPDPEVDPGESVWVELEIINYGDDDYTGVEIFDELPENLTLGEIIIIENGAIKTSDQGPNSGDTGDITWGTWDLPSGTGIIIKYEVMVPEDAQDGEYETGSVQVYTDQTGFIADLIEAGDSLKLIIRKLIPGEPTSEPDSGRQNNNPDDEGDEDDQDDEDGEDDGDEDENDKEQPVYYNQQDNRYVVVEDENDPIYQIINQGQDNDESQEGQTINPDLAIQEQVSLEEITERQKHLDELNSDKDWWLNLLKALLAILGGSGGMMVFLGVNSNPMGLALGEHNISFSKKINLVKKLRGSFYKPKNISIKNWQK
ncbi:MAG: hypothetical protein GF332_02200 [Candidatus Moranbacteria bacterium]|nr:hypothetical protein [Candidatus Moranbacteria bacterium]